MTRSNRAELLPGTIETTGCGMYFQDVFGRVFGDVGSVLDSRYRLRETLALIPNMMYLKRVNQRVRN